MRLPILMLAALPAVAAPEFELKSDWFAYDAAEGVTNGVALTSTSTGLVFTPVSPLLASAPATVEATVVFSEADVGAARQLRPLSADVPFALAVASTGKARLAFFGWTAEGWVELSGFEPTIGQPLDVKAEIDFGVVPAEVQYSAGGVLLVSADSAAKSVFRSAVAAANRFDAIVAEGDIGVRAASATRELVERVAAVVVGETVAGYFSSLAAARAAAALDGGAVTLLRRTSLDDPRALEGETIVNPTAFRGGTAALNYTGDLSALAKTRAVVRLPEGYDADQPFFSPDSSEALEALHVHGDEGAVYTLYPKDGAFNLRKDALVADGGNFTASFTVPEGGRSFLRGLKDGRCGSENALYVNGLGALVLCGTNAFTGKVFVESSSLVAYGGLDRATAAALAKPSNVEFVASFAAEGEGHVEVVNNTVVFSGVTDELAQTLTFTLDPGSGRLGYLKREGSDLVAKIAAAPEIAVEEGFSVTSAVAEDKIRLTATLANAVQGFRYGWCAADAPDGAFAPVGETVAAARDGSLAVELEESAAERRFYRFRVEAP